MLPESNSTPPPKSTLAPAWPVPQEASAPTPPVAPRLPPSVAVIVTVPSLYSVRMKPAFSPISTKPILITELYVSPSSCTMHFSGMKSESSGDAASSPPAAAHPRSVWRIVERLRQTALRTSAPAGPMARITAPTTSAATTMPPMYSTAEAPRCRAWRPSGGRLRAGRVPSTSMSSFLAPTTHDRVATEARQ